MAFRVVRLRREARRIAKLEEIFAEKDKIQCGTIHVDQVSEIFRMYEVNLDEAALSKVVTDEGLISKADFIKLGQDLKLLEFGGPMGEKRKLATPRKERKLEHEENLDNLHWLCCCCINPRLQSPADEDASRELKRDRVLTAFTTWDLDGDGYLSWDEFQRISNNTVMSQEQALRIFQHCDKTGRGKISLEEFRETVNSRPESRRGDKYKVDNVEECQSFIETSY